MIVYTLRRLASALLLTAVVTCATFVLIFRNGPSIARAILGEQAPRRPSTRGPSSSGWTSR